MITSDLPRPCVLRSMQHITSKDADNGLPVHACEHNRVNRYYKSILYLWLRYHSQKSVSRMLCTTYRGFVLDPDSGAV